MPEFARRQQFERVAVSLILFSLLSCSANKVPSESDGAGAAGGAPPNCSAERTLCDSVCVDTSSEVAHCGSCDSACPDGQQCVDSVCALQCGGETSACGAACVDSSVNPNHCGGCDNACPSAPGALVVCVDSKCAWICDADHADCNLEPADGCEIDLSKDLNNCGSCNNACPLVDHGQTSCESGSCAIASCDADWGDCDMTVANGCEASLLNDTAHCSACNSPCNLAANEQCLSGVCKTVPFNYQVLETKNVNYQGIDYLLLKVSYLSQTSIAANWCAEYLALCQSYGYVPTGCGSNFNSGGYGYCKSKYLSDGVSNTLNCNASSGVAAAAKQAGYADASSTNSFAFHSCNDGPDTSCGKTMCTGDYCNNALSYFGYSKPHGYTLCKK